MEQMFNSKNEVFSDVSRHMAVPAAYIPDTLNMHCTPVQSIPANFTDTFQAGSANCVSNRSLAVLPQIHASMPTKCHNLSTPEISVDPTSVMDQYCWCKFNHKEYGLSKDQVKQVNEVMIDKASEHLRYEDFEGCMTRDSVYLELLKHFEYKSVEATDPDSGKACTAYMCLFGGCGKQFSRAWNLLNHARMHEGVKPYSCQICHKAFTQKGNLKKHILTHLLPQIENRKRYKCEWCDKGYTEKYNYMVSLTLIHLL